MCCTGGHSVYLSAHLFTRTFMCEGDTCGCRQQYLRIGMLCKVEVCDFDQHRHYAIFDSGIFLASSILRNSSCPLAFFHLQTSTSLLAE